MLELSHGIKLYHQDNVEFMASFTDDFFCLAHIDPPYGIKASKPTKKPHRVKQTNGKVLKVKETGYKPKQWDMVPASKEFGKEIFRISKNQIIWGANFFDWIVDKPFKPPRRHEYKEFIKKHPKGWIIWDKVNGDSDQYDCELAWTSLDIPTSIIYFMWRGMMQGSLADGTKQEGNKKLNEKRIHPTQKPVRLYEKVIIKIKQELPDLKKVVDTGLGSGSHAIACAKNELELYGCEIDDDYWDKLVNWINLELKKLNQLNLFG